MDPGHRPPPPPLQAAVEVRRLPFCRAEARPAEVERSPAGRRTFPVFLLPPLVGVGGGGGGAGGLEEGLALSAHNGALRVYVCVCVCARARARVRACACVHVCVRPAVNH